MPGSAFAVVDLGPRARAVFTGRRGGASRPPYDGLNLALHVGDDPATVVHNRASVTTVLGLDLDRTAWAEQVHAAAVATVTGADAGRGARTRETALPGADALVTGEADLALGVLTADCVPVVLAGGEAVAAVHAGWRGLLAGVVERALAALPAGTPEAVIGPAVGPCCYEVGADVYDAVTARHPRAAAATEAGRPALDLRAAVAAVLEAAGVAGARLVGGCTAHHPAAYFSHRRDGVTGRQAALVWLR